MPRGDRRSGPGGKSPDVGNFRLDTIFFYKIFYINKY